MDLVILAAGWLIIFVTLCIGLYCANPADPFDGPAFGCDECEGSFPTRSAFEAHECVRQVAS